ncbi:putative CCR4-associated factor [Canna indica]|uniref:poly(A)-specific ribonuclease n=1 Tax=Canna indica TaxID=4628 RepID=A0AAQ3KP81_9LILI|nr:putative CCR4-associated factor [Canna indica]
MGSLGASPGRGRDTTTDTVAKKMEAFRRRQRVAIRSVWAWNLDYEMSLIASLIPSFRFISFDTEFPGVVVRRADGKPHYHLSDDERYGLLKANVDYLNIIQLGLTLFDAAGNVPDLGMREDDEINGFAWEFNFRDFDVRRHPYAPSSIELLRSSGVPIERLPFHGIDSRRFADLFFASDIGSTAAEWVAFHGSYDVAYLLKVLTKGRPLPPKLDQFLFAVGTLLGDVVDVKHLMRFCDDLDGGLERVAGALEVPRLAGASHQAGSDSLLTSLVFLKIKEKYFWDDDGEVAGRRGVIFGLQDY